jgi:hypothetical protein
LSNIPLLFIDYLIVSSPYRAARPNIPIDLWVLRLNGFAHFFKSLTSI